ncbi:hypothetical protein U1Q18_019574 [Sarracenia purpurea var. burkii]
MLVQTQIFCPAGILPRTLGSAKTPFGVTQLNGITNLHYGQMKNRGAIFSVSEGQNSRVDVGMKRKVVEHICLLKAKEDLSDEKEKDMMDYLYTSQYQMGGIVAVSLAFLVCESSSSRMKIKL